MEWKEIFEFSLCLCSCLESKIILVVDAKFSLSSTTKISKTMAFSNEFLGLPTDFFRVILLDIIFNKTEQKPTHPRMHQASGDLLSSFPFNKDNISTEKMKKKFKEKKSIIFIVFHLKSAAVGRIRINSKYAKRFFRYLLFSLPWIPSLEFLLWRWQIPAAPHPSPSLEATPQSTQFLSKFPSW